MPPPQLAALGIYSREGFAVARQEPKVWTVLIRLSPKDTIGGVFGQSKPTTSSGLGRKPDKHGLDFH